MKISCNKGILVKPQDTGESSGEECGEEEEEVKQINLEISRKAINLTPRIGILNETSFQC